MTSALAALVTAEYVAIGLNLPPFTVEALPLSLDTLDALIERYLPGEVSGWVDFEREEVTKGSVTYRMSQAQLGELGVIKIYKSGERWTAMGVSGVPPLSCARREHQERVIQALFNRLARDPAWMAAFQELVGTRLLRQYRTRAGIARLKYRLSLSGGGWTGNKKFVDWECSKCGARFATEEGAAVHTLLEHGEGIICPRLSAAGVEMVMTMLIRTDSSKEPLPLDMSKQIALYIVKTEEPNILCKMERKFKPIVIFVARFSVQVLNEKLEVTPDNLFRIVRGWMGWHKYETQRDGMISIFTNSGGGDLPVYHVESYTDGVYTGNMGPIGDFAGRVIMDALTPTTTRVRVDYTWPGVWVKKGTEFTHGITPVKVDYSTNLLDDDYYSDRPRMFKRLAQYILATVKGDVPEPTPSQENADRAGAPAAATPSATTPAALRARLQRLDSVEIESLCLDHFPVVYDKFARGLRHDEMLNLLLDHCRRNPEDAARLAQLLS